MNPAAIALNNRTTTLVLSIAVVIGGLSSFGSLGRLEDPEFTIKDAKISTAYPGATAREVEEEVTDLLEKAVQQLGQLKYVESVSMPGLSIITATMKDRYDKHGLPQVWDELRRKIGDAQSRLPPGAGPSLVNDDFGDVFGVFLAITGDGFSYAEIKEHVKMLERELLLVDDVAKVALYGIQQEVVYIEISRARLAQLGISEDRVYAALAQRNFVEPAGDVEVGREYVRIRPTGALDAVADIGRTVIDPAFADGRLFLEDIATITRAGCASINASTQGGVLP